MWTILQRLPVAHVELLIVNKGEAGEGVGHPLQHSLDLYST